MLWIKETNENKHELTQTDMQKDRLDYYYCLCRK